MQELKVELIPSEVKPKDKRLEEMKLRETLPKHPANVMILGRCGSGKSCCLYSMLKDGYVTSSGKSIFDEMVVYLGTGDAVDAFYKLPCKNIRVLTDFDNIKFEGYLDNLRAHQLERLEKGKHPLNVAIVFDDLAATKLMKPTKKGGTSPLEHLLITSRHEAHASIFYCSQIYKNSGFSKPIARNNMTNYIIYSMSTAEIDKFCDEHCGLMTKEEFMAWYDKCMLTKYNFITINYKKDEDNGRFCERFTKVYVPEKLRHNRRLLEDSDSEISESDLEA